MKSKRSRIIKNLDIWFSRYIRLKYSKKGICVCISCGKKEHRKKVHNAHRISRGKMRYRRDEDNCRPACVSCNNYRPEFHIREFTIQQVERLGLEKINEMRLLSETPKNWKLFELENMLVYYKSEVKKLSEG